MKRLLLLIALIVALSLCLTACFEDVDGTDTEGEGNTDKEGDENTDTEGDENTDTEGGENRDEHIHDYSFSTEKTDPTCAKDGAVISYCSCGDSKKEILPATGIHTEVSDVGFPKSCTEDGLTDGKHCSVCNEIIIKQEIISATGHEYENEYRCDAEFHWHKCENCDDTDTKENHSFDDFGSCSFCYQELFVTEGVLYEEYFEGGFMEVVGYVGTDTVVRIANTVNGLPVEGIAPYAFAECDKITAIILPKTLKSISYYSFRGCTSLVSIGIPASVTYIDSSAFNSCTSLERINVRTNNPSYLTVDGSLYTKDRTTLMHYACGKADTGFEIPDGVTVIDHDAFYGCLTLEKVIIPDGVTQIGNAAFAFCPSLNTIKIPDSVEIVDDYAFIGCTALASATIGNSVTRIGLSAFSDCTSLTSISIPKSVNQIDDFAFYSCFNLASIEVDTDNENYQSIDGNLYTKDGKTLVQYAIGNSASSFVVPDGVEAIGKGAFAYAGALNSITIPGSVKTIGENAFTAIYSVLDVYYSGNQEEWSQVVKEYGNDPIINATMHFDYAE